MGYRSRRDARGEGKDPRHLHGLLGMAAGRSRRSYRIEGPPLQPDQPPLPLPADARVPRLGSLLLSVGRLSAALDKGDGGALVAVECRPRSRTICNEYARKIALGQQLSDAFSHTRLPLFRWANGAIPNDLEGKDSVRIRDTAPIFRLEGDELVGSMTTWAWLNPRSRKPVFNFVADGRNFSANDRVAILATGFYEYTAPADPKVKLKDRHLFTMSGQDWFWIAGIVKEGCFTMLTVPPGPDVAPYHDRQIATLTPQAGLDWLALSRPQGELLATPDAGTFDVVTLRRDGAEVS